MALPKKNHKVEAQVHMAMTDLNVEAQVHMAMTDLNVEAQVYMAMTDLMCQAMDQMLNCLASQRAAPTFPRMVRATTDLMDLVKAHRMVVRIDQAFVLLMTDLGDQDRRWRVPT